MTARLVIMVLLISGLCAAQLLPFYDLLKHSQRPENHFGAASSPIPVSGWINFIIPLFGCGEADGVFFQPGQNWIMSYYTGVITVGLAALALWRRPCAQVWLSGVLSIFCVLLAMGDATPVYHWLCSHVSVFGLMRFPVKFLILPIFVLPIMTAYALEEKSAVPGQNMARSGKKLAISMARDHRTDCELFRLASHCAWRQQSNFLQRTGPGYFVHYDRYRTILHRKRCSVRAALPVTGTGTVAGLAGFGSSDAATANCQPSYLSTQYDTYVAGAEIRHVAGGHHGHRV